MRYFRSLLFTCLICLPLFACSKKEEESAKPVTIQLVHGPELRAYLSSIKDAFYQTNPTLPDGSTVRIELVNQMAETAAKSLSTGELKGDAWLSQNSALVDYTNNNIVNLGTRFINCRELFKSPVVVAGLRTQLSQFIDSNDRISLVNLLQIAEERLHNTNEDLPNIVYGFGKPRQAVTGLASLIELAYISKGSSEAITSADLADGSNVRKRLEDYQAMVSNYDLSESMLLTRTAQGLSKTIRFTLTTEQQVTSFSSTNENKGYGLTGFFPAEGSYFLSYQYCLGDADRITAAQHAGMALFGNFLVGMQAQTEAEKLGFRPSAITSGTTQTAESKQVSEAKAFPQISGDTAFYLLNKWNDIMRPSAVVYILDSSGSMEGESLRIAKMQIRNSLARSQTRDVRALVSFSSEPRVETSFTNDIPTLMNKLDEVQSSGGSAIYDSIKQAVELLSAPEVLSLRKSIVIITDGDDKNSRLSIEELLSSTARKIEQMDISISLIGLDTQGTALDDLDRIAQGLHGAYFKTDLNNLTTVMSEVWRNL